MGELIASDKIKDCVRVIILSDNTCTRTCNCMLTARFADCNRLALFAGDLSVITKWPAASILYTSSQLHSCTTFIPTCFFVGGRGGIGYSMEWPNSFRKKNAIGTYCTLHGRVKGTAHSIFVIKHTSQFYIWTIMIMSLPRCQFFRLTSLLSKTHWTQLWSFWRVSIDLQRQKRNPPDNPCWLRIPLS